MIQNYSCLCIVENRKHNILSTFSQNGRPNYFPYLINDSKTQYEVLFCEYILPTFVGIQSIF